MSQEEISLHVQQLDLNERKKALKAREAEGGAAEGGGACVAAASSSSTVVVVLTV